jgi:hypothetical protein
MATSYESQAAQVNEELAPESSLNLTLTQHPHNEDLKLRKVHLRFEVDPLRAWYYYIFLNFRTLMILLQVNPVSNDEPEIVCEGYYETENIFIFAWSLIPGIGHLVARFNYPTTS